VIKEGLFFMKDRQWGRVRFISGENKGRYPFSHSVYIEGEKARIVIDPASSLDKLSLLRDTESVDTVWLSHWHEDHFKYLYLFDHCSLGLSERDFPPMTDINVLLDWCGIETESYRDYWKNTVQKKFRYQPRKEARFIKDGEIIDCGSVTVEAILTPGHTPGHLSFFFREEKVLFLGDYDLTSFGPWYGDFHSDIDDTIKSIRRLQKIPAKIWITSHEKGLFEENPGEIWQRYENVIYERDSKILEFLGQPRTPEEILSAWLIYGKSREPIEFFEFAERSLLKKHLQRLEKLNRIILDNNHYAVIK
jgi:glyoxylase-like metal-dependent hydrolase (beta-lactamase superfamily II)